jgi:hypothetical protein
MGDVVFVTEGARYVGSSICLALSDVGFAPVIDNKIFVVIGVTWDPFRALDLDGLKGLMAKPVRVDLRNIYRSEDMAVRGFRYSGIGRG